MGSKNRKIKIFNFFSLACARAREETRQTGRIGHGDSSRKNPDGSRGDRGTEPGKPGGSGAHRRARPRDHRAATASITTHIITDPGPMPCLWLQNVLAKSEQPGHRGFLLRVRPGAAHGDGQQVHRLAGWKARGVFAGGKINLPGCSSGRCGVARRAGRRRWAHELHDARRCVTRATGDCGARHHLPTA